MSNAAPVETALFERAPLLRLQGWLGLVKPGEANVARRVVFAVLIGWLPLVVLVALQDGALRAFLSDFAVYARSLIAVSLFIVADVLCAPRLGAIARHFLEAGLVTEPDRARYTAAIASTRRLGDSIWADIIVVALAYSIIAVLICVVPVGGIRVWHQSAGAVVAVYSWAGWWHALVSLPLLLVLFLGWMWRFLLWTRFLWLMARLDLRLIASHPDKVAGLKFVAFSVRAFAILGCALGVILAGTVANGIAAGTELNVYRYTIGGVAVFTVVLFNAPLLMFTGTLRREWQRGVLDYGALADGFGREFEHKWINRKEQVNAGMLEQPDFSAATDLYQVVDRVHEISLIPLDVPSVVLVATATLLPFAPVVFMALPFDQIVKAVAGVLL